MKKRKTIIAAIVLSLVLVVGGALAYFTDTDTETNTFTLGNVSIDLQEPNWVAADAEDIMPGDTVAKDPQITNDGAADAYVFLKITEPCYNNATIFDFTPNAAWTAVGTARTCNGSTAETVYGYGTASAMTTLAKNTTTPALFSNVTLKSTLDEAAVQSFTNGADIVVDAYGIQADNVTGTPAQIFANFS